MGRLSLLAIAVALAMDAFAVAVVTGLTRSPLKTVQVLRMTSSFGLFQALMPVLGWAAGTAIRDEISATDHWVAFVLLAFVGGKMMWTGLRGDEATRVASDPTAGWSLLLLSVATSVDALAVGLSLAMLKTGIVFPAVVIGITAAVLTAIGMLLGRHIGAVWGRRVEVLGGVVLVLIGARIVVQHTLVR
jgi:manganese efflux pump family protein